MKTRLRASNHRKASHLKSTIKFISKTSTSIETTQGRWEEISNIRLKIGSKVVIQASGVRLDPIMLRVRLKTGIMGGRSTWSRATFMITIKTAIKMCILIAKMASSSDFNNSEVVRRKSWIMIPKPTMKAICIPMGSSHSLIYSTCKKYSSSIHHRRIIYPKKTKTPPVFRAVRPTTFATTSSWFLVHPRWEKRGITDEAIKSWSMTSHQKNRFRTSSAIRNPKDPTNQINQVPS